MNRGVKSILCVLLVLNLHVWQGGCGTGATALADGWIRLAVSGDQLLGATARGSALGDVLAVDVHPPTSRFRLLLSDASKQVTGTFERFAGKDFVTQVEFQGGGLAARFELDALRRVRRITTSTGQDWRPQALDLTPPFSPGVSELDRYLAMNASLLEQVRQLDARYPGGASSVGGGGSTGGGGTIGGTPPFQSGAKTAAADQDITADSLLPILGVLIALFSIPLIAGGLPAIYFVIQVVVGVSIILSLLGTPSTAGAVSDASSGGVTGDATLRVVNELTGGVPIWYVVLLQSGGPPGADGNLLGDESIPAGAAREFRVPVGDHSFNVITPDGAECFRIYSFAVQVNGQGIAEIVLTDAKSGTIYPPDCAD